MQLKSSTIDVVCISEMNISTADTELWLFIAAPFPFLSGNTNPWPNYIKIMAQSWVDIIQLQHTETTCFIV